MKKWEQMQKSAAAEAAAPAIRRPLPVKWSDNWAAAAVENDAGSETWKGGRKGIILQYYRR